MADPSRTASVGDGLDGLKRVGLPASAHQRPDRFDQYLYFRPEMIAAWDRGEAWDALPESAQGDEAWQRDLWRRLSALAHDSKLTVNDPHPEASHRPILYDSGRPSSVIWFRTLHATTDSATRPPRDRARSRSQRIDLYRKNAFSTRAWSW